MSDREKIVGRIKALLQMTVANGCTEEEAASAARLAAKLMAEHEITETERSVEEDVYGPDTIQILTPHVAERMWKPAHAIAKLTACRCWTSPSDHAPVTLTFFGEEHAVKIAKYLLAICFRAMESGKAKVEYQHRLQPNRVRSNLGPYLDGMADRLMERIFGMIPKVPTGTGLVPLKFALIDAALKKAGHDLRQGFSGRSRQSSESYRHGREHADRVNLNPGITTGRNKDFIR